MQELEGQRQPSDNIPFSILFTNVNVSTLFKDTTFALSHPHLYYIKRSVILNFLKYLL